MDSTSIGRTKFQSRRLVPDGAVVLLLRNELAHAQLLQIQVGARVVSVELPPDSLSTLNIKRV